MKKSVKALGYFSAITAFLGALVLIVYAIALLVFPVIWLRWLILILLAHVFVLFGLIVLHAIRKEKQTLTLILSIIWIIMLSSSLVVLSMVYDALV
jgi:hypothetical protein